MKDYQEAMLKSLVAVAWADGDFADEEAEVIEALVSTFDLGESDAAKVRTYAATERTLDDVPVTELSAGDRRLLLQHAVVLSHVDGDQADSERNVIHKLVDKLKIPKQEADDLIAAANARAKRLLELLED